MDNIKNTSEIKEEELPQVNIKRLKYKSKIMEIITDKPLDDKNEFGFLRNDLPPYAR